MRYMLLAFFCMMPMVWADYQATPGRQIDLTELTIEFKQAVPELQGCAGNHVALSCRRETDDFSPAEIILLDAALAAHNADIRTKRSQQQETKRQQQEQRSRQKLGLTEKEFEDLKEALQ